MCRQIDTPATWIGAAVYRPIACELYTISFEKYHYFPRTTAEFLNRKDMITNLIRMNYPDQSDFILRGIRANGFFFKTGGPSVIYYSSSSLFPPPWAQHNFRRLTCRIMGHRASEPMTWNVKAVADASRGGRIRCRRRMRARADGQRGRNGIGRRAARIQTVRRTRAGAMPERERWEKRVGPDTMLRRAPDPPRISPSLDSPRCRHRPLTLSPPPLNAATAFAGRRRRRIGLSLGSDTARGTVVSPPLPPGAACQGRVRLLSRLRPPRRQRRRERESARRERGRERGVKGGRGERVYIIGRPHHVLKENATVATRMPEDKPLN